MTKWQEQFDPVPTLFCQSCWLDYCIHSKYWDTLIFYHASPLILITPFDYLLMCLKIAGCVANSVALDQNLCSGSTLFA